DRLACSAIGPNFAWSAVAISPSGPLVGTCVLFVTGGVVADGSGVGDGATVGDGLGLGDGEGDGAADGAAEAPPEAAGVAVAAGVGVAVAVGAADAELEGRGVGDRVGTGVGDGSTSRRSSFVSRMSRNVLPVAVDVRVVTVASGWPSVASSAFTWSAVTFGSW